MNLGFPIQLIPKLCCPHDGEALEPGHNCQLSENNDFIKYGTLCCNKCNASFAIDDGILNMLNATVLDEESKREQRLRNEHAIQHIKTSDAVWYENEHNSMEMIPTLEALSVGKEETILELGCGDGRYTIPVANQCQWIVAVDFSLESLRILKQRLHDTQNVALVLCDITTLKVSAANFDCVLSTLVSNLPSREHRNAMYQLARNALKPNGRFIFSTHNHGLRQKLGNVVKSGTYKHGGIYRYNFTIRECKAEVLPYFEVIKANPVQIYFPFAGKLRLPLVALSRFLERIPLINNLGEVILCTAKRPTQSAPGEKIG